MNLAIFLKQVKLAELLIPRALQQALKLNGITQMKQMYKLYEEFEKTGKITSAILSQNSNQQLRRAEQHLLGVQLHNAVKSSLRTNGVLKAEQVVPLAKPVTEEVYDYRKQTPVTRTAPKPALVTTNLSQVQLQNAAQARLAEVLAEGKVRLPDFNDIAELKKLRAIFSTTKEELDAAYGQLNRALSKLDVLAIASSMSVATAAHLNILVSGAEKAFKVNYDLDIASWKSHLLSQLNKPELITITPVYSGDTSTQRVTLTAFNVNIEDNLKAQLGTIEDYGTAVKATRAMLGYGGRVQGPLASGLWFRQLWQVARGGGGVLVRKLSDKTREIKEYTNLKTGKTGKHPVVTKVIYRQAKPGETKVKQDREEKLTEFYWDIMRTRLEQMGSKAPYWYLLNFGSAAAGAIAKGGGSYAAPTLTPTYFVAAAEKVIATKLLAEFNSKSQKGNLAISDLRLKIASVEKKLGIHVEILSLLDTLIAGLSGPSIEQIYNKALEMAITKINLAFANALVASKDSEVLRTQVESRINAFATLVLAQETSGKRIDIATVQKKRYRYRTVDLTKQVAEEIKGVIPKDKTTDLVNRAKQKVAEIQRELMSVKAQVK